MSNLRGHLNNFSTTLVAGISDSATSFDLTDTTGISTLLGTYDYLPLTIDDGTNIEIIHVTAVSTDTITCTRGTEGTTATAFSAGDQVECRATAASLLTETPYFNVWTTSDSVGTSSEKIDFTNADHDPQGWFDLTTNDQYEPLLAGTYFLTVACAFDDPDDGSNIIVQPRLGSTTLTTTTQQVLDAATSPDSPERHTIYATALATVDGSADSSNVISCNAYHTGTGTKNIRVRFIGYRIGD